MLHARSVCLAGMERRCFETCYLAPLVRAECEFHFPLRHPDLCSPPMRSTQQCTMRSTQQYTMRSTQQCTMRSTQQYAMRSTEQYIMRSTQQYTMRSTEQFTRFVPPHEIHTAFPCNSHSSAPDLCPKGLMYETQAHAMLQGEHHPPTFSQQ